jgi:hypothetical protein
MRKVTLAGLVLPTERLDPPDVGATLCPAPPQAGPSPACAVGRWGKAGHQRCLTRR